MMAGGEGGEGLGCVDEGGFRRGNGMLTREDKNESKVVEQGKL